MTQHEDTNPPDKQARYHIALEGATAAQVGDRNIQYNNFYGQIHSAVAMPIVPTNDAPSSVFVGRAKEVNFLLKLLNPGEQTMGTVVVSAVAGLAGVGKTALAHHVTATAVSNGWFPGGAVMVDLHGYDSDRYIDSAQVFVPALRALGIESNKIPPAPDEQPAAYHRILTSLANEGKSALFLFDNASSAAQVADLIPAHKSHRVLVTSRHTFGDLDNARLLELDVLSMDEAISMLDQALQRRSTKDNRVNEQPQEATNLIQLCGNLPLALQIVAALLAEERLRPLADLCAELADAKTRLDGLAYGERAVRASFDLSWQHLVDHDQWAAKLFRLISVNPGPDFSVDTAAAIAGQQPVLTGRQLRTLRRAHLIEQSFRIDRWKMHDLVNLYSINLGEEYANEDGRESSRGRLVKYYRDMTVGAGSWLYSRPEREALRFFPSRQSGLQWLADEHANLVAAVQLSSSLGEDNWTIDLSCYMSPYLESHRYLSDALAVSEVALKSARTLKIAVREAGVLNNIGVALTSMRKYKEAIRYLNKAVAKARTANDKIEEATALTSLAGALRQHYGPHLGIDELQRARRISLEAGDPRAAAFAMTNLGIALREAGRFEQAKQILQEALDIHAKGDAKRAEASTLAQLGTTLSQMGDLSSSIPLLKNAIAAYREVGDSNGEASATMNMGNIFRTRGDIRAAHKNYLRALQIFHDTNDPHGVALVQANIGATMREMGESERAEEFLAAAREGLSAIGDTRALESMNWD